MKKFILIPVLVSLCVGSTINYNFGSTAYAKTTTPTACEIRTTTTEASKEGQEFVEYILEKENIDINSDTTSVEYYDDGTASVTTILENGDAEIFSSLTKAQAKDIYEYQKSKSENDERGLVSEAIFWAIVQIYNILKNAGKVVGYSCAIVQMTGNGNPCAYLTDQIIQGLINSQQAKYEVSQYIYKDSACPYPINSLQCSQPPYAYTKTYLKRVS